MLAFGDIIAVFSLAFLVGFRDGAMIFFFFFGLGKPVMFRFILLLRVELELATLSLTDAHSELESSVINLGLIKGLSLALVLLLVVVFSSSFFSESGEVSSLLSIVG